MEMYEDDFLLPSRMGACYLKEDAVYFIKRLKLDKKIQKEQSSKSQNQS